MRVYACSLIPFNQIDAIEKLGTEAIRLYVGFINVSSHTSAVHAPLTMTRPTHVLLVEFNHAWVLSSVAQVWI